MLRELHNGNEKKREKKRVFKGVCVCDGGGGGARENKTDPDQQGKPHCLLNHLL